VRPSTARGPGAVRPAGARAIPDGRGARVAEAGSGMSGKSAFRSPVQMNSPNSPGAVPRPFASTSIMPTSAQMQRSRLVNSLAHATRLAHAVRSRRTGTRTRG